MQITKLLKFEGIAKTNTTNTEVDAFRFAYLFEGIAKTNTTHEF